MLFTLFVYLSLLARMLASTYLELHVTTTIAKNNLSPVFMKHIFSPKTLTIYGTTDIFMQIVYIQFYMVQNQSHSGVQKPGTWFPMKSKIQKAY